MVRSWASADIKRRFDVIVAFAEIKKFIETPMKHYSSGMYVRLGFAIAVHNDPDILLVDEGRAVGDLAFQRKCFDKMAEVKNSSRTFILISHSMPQIKSLCQRAIMLRSGRLVADGAPDEVGNAPTADTWPSIRWTRKCCPMDAKGLSHVFYRHMFSIFPLMP
jgi:lipopolysaccharide transport system ATP-binding protein